MDGSISVSSHLPVLGNVEAPLELEMLLLIVVNECRDRVIVTARKHSGRCVFLLDCEKEKLTFKPLIVVMGQLTSLAISGLFVCVGSVASLWLLSECLDTWRR
jgi:hypothetical protein